MTHAHFMGLFFDSARALHLQQRGLAELLGTSLRTVQRWSVGRATPSVPQVGRLAAAVYAVNPDLARRLAGSVELELNAPTISPVAALLVESVVAAAADVLALPPRTMRPALLAAVERARAASLGVDDLLAALRSPAPAP